VRGKTVFLCLWAICMVLGGVRAGEAADWVVTPSIETKAQYLNNIFYSPTLRVSDYILSAGPKLDFNYNTEVTQLGGSLKFMGLHYTQNSNIDRIDQYYNIQGSTQATPRINLKLATSFVSTSTPSEYLAATGGVLTNNRLVSFISVSPGMTYNLTERWSTVLTYSFLNVSYQEEAYNNYLSHTINDRLNYLLNEKTTLIASITAYNAKYQKLGNTISALGPQLGFSRKFSEKWDMEFLGGVNINQINSNVAVLSFDNVSGFAAIRQRKQETSSITPFFTLGTDYRWEKGGMKINYVRNQSANAYQNQSQYNNFILNFTQQITEKLDFGLGPYVYLSSIKGGNSNYNSNYIGIRPVITYKLTEKTSLSANYSFSYRTVTGTTSYSYPINDVWLSLSYSYPLHYQH
jgi:hypothetical protein